MQNKSEFLEEQMHDHTKTLERVRKSLLPLIIQGGEQIVRTLKSGKKILLCGNGGSAADAQHIAAELTGRYKVERRGLPAVALTTDSSALTAIGNDYGYERVFDRQVEALASEGDLLLAISTSGNSANVLRALERARSIGCFTLGLSGKGGGEMNALCDLNLIIPSDDTPRIQEMHMMIGHLLCAMVDEAFREEEK